MMNYTTAVEFGIRLKRMFRRRKYRTFTKRFTSLGEWDFHCGGCYMVAHALKKLIPTGVIGAIAEWTPNPDSDKGGDWPLHHYVFLPIPEPVVLDSRGLFEIDMAIQRVALNVARTGHKVGQMRLAPLDANWSGEGLWQGDHGENYDDDVFDSIVLDTHDILLKLGVKVSLPIS